MIPASQQTKSADRVRHRPQGPGLDVERGSSHDIEERCRAAGLKMTEQRRVILRVLASGGDHPNVEELYRLAVAIDPRISIATVYRTVRVFEEKGLLSRLDFGRGRARYEPSDHGRHHHIIDVDTGAVTEFQDDELDALLLRISERLGFNPISHRLDLFGRRRSAKSKA
jgi:Fur family transcriptional regulator, ferric uptake regulator